MRPPVIPRMVQDPSLRPAQVGGGEIGGEASCPLRFFTGLPHVLAA